MNHSIIDQFYSLSDSELGEIIEASPFSKASHIALKILLVRSRDLYDANNAILSRLTEPDLKKSVYQQSNVVHKQFIELSFSSNLQQILILPFIIILIVMLAIMAQITNLNPAGIGYGLTGVANFTLYGVVLTLIVVLLALPIYYGIRIVRKQLKSTNRTLAVAPRILPGDLITSDSERVRALTYTGSVESDQVIPPLHQGPVTPISNTRRYKPFILPTAPLEQQVTQQVIIQPPAPGIGQRTTLNTDANPKQRSPIKFRRGSSHNPKPPPINP